LKAAEEEHCPFEGELLAAAPREDDSTIMTLF